MVSVNLASSATDNFDPFNGWENYPSNIEGQNTLISSASSLSDRLTRLKETLFSSAISVLLIGVDDKGSITPDSKVYNDAASVEDVLRKDVLKPPRIRIISLHSKKTIWPLRVTEPLMRKILTAYRVDPAFLHVLFSSGQSPDLSESGSRNFARDKSTDGSEEISYQLRYVEENQRSGNQPWSPRHTGIYHHHSAAGNFDLFIFLNPYPLEECVVERQLFNLTKSKETVKSFLENPYRLHLLPFAAYVDNWRWYFRYLGNGFAKKNDRIMTLDLDDPSSVRLNFNEVQKLRELGDTTLSLEGHCQCAQSIMERLQAIPEAKFDHEWSLQPYLDRLSDNVTSITALTNRINNSIDLAAYFLELKNQDIAAKINKTMSELTSKTNKDTTSMKWITILALVYLPGNFVCTLYGMNLFAFSQENRQLVIAEDFWIFVVTWLPLTLFTFLGYFWLRRSHESRGNGLLSKMKAVRLKPTLPIGRRKPDTSDQDLESSSCTSGQA